MLASLVKNHILKSWEPKSSGSFLRKKETWDCWVMCLGCIYSFLNQEDKSKKCSPPLLVCKKIPFRGKQ